MPFTHCIKVKVSILAHWEPKSTPTSEIGSNLGFMIPKPPQVHRALSYGLLEGSGWKNRRKKNFDPKKLHWNPVIWPIYSGTFSGCMFASRTTRPRERRDTRLCWSLSWLMLMLWNFNSPEIWMMSRIGILWSTGSTTLRCMQIKIPKCPPSWLGRGMPMKLIWVRKL